MQPKNSNRRGGDDPATRLGLAIAGVVILAIALLVYALGLSVSAPAASHVAPEAPGILGLALLTGAIMALGVRRTRPGSPFGV